MSKVLLPFPEHLFYHANIGRGAQTCSVVGRIAMEKGCLIFESPISIIFVLNGSPSPWKKQFQMLRNLPDVEVCGREYMKRGHRLCTL